jgi:hypothetical protein
MYGNIGSRTRLDFTVIGPAVNMASRLKILTKQLGRTVPPSRAFANFVESDFDLERVGEYRSGGFNDPIELFAYHGGMRIYCQVPRRPQRGANSSNRHYRRMWSRWLLVPATTRRKTPAISRNCRCFDWLL